MLRDVYDCFQKTVTMRFAWKEKELAFACAVVTVMSYESLAYLLLLRTK